ncbi:hypothetical protein [Rickettsiella endosymbiont of Miltochrista miniata]|uniref:hypothetical protein n=1 Tax=Rickettsiella endosymbiont of Miltochrista miniata TaxID=3066239 RepID=UPI00313D67BD
MGKQHVFNRLFFHHTLAHFYSLTCYHNIILAILRYNKTKTKIQDVVLLRLERSIDLKALKEDFRKIGINFITAGVVGVFINHYVGIDFWTMSLTSAALTTTGIISLYLGLRKNKQ